jgi:hypothetical protein
MDTDSASTIGKNARNCPRKTMSASCPLIPAGGTCVGKPYSTLRPPLPPPLPVGFLHGSFFRLRFSAPFIFFRPSERTRRRLPGPPAFFIPTPPLSSLSSVLALKLWRVRLSKSMFLLLLKLLLFSLNPLNIC